MVRELAPALREHKVRAEGGQARALQRGVGLGLAPSGGVDGRVLQEEQDVLGRGGAALLELQGVDGFLQLKGAEVGQGSREIVIKYGREQHFDRLSGPSPIGTAGMYHVPVTTTNRLLTTPNLSKKNIHSTVIQARCRILDFVVMRNERDNYHRIHDGFP